MTADTCLQCAQILVDPRISRCSSPFFKSQRICSHAHDYGSQERRTSVRAALLSARALDATASTSHVSPVDATRNSIVKNLASKQSRVQKHASPHLTMHFRQCLTLCLSSLCIFWHAAFCAPTSTEPASLHTLHGGSGFNIISPKPLNDSLCSALGSVSWHETTWPISNTPLSLVLHVCNWELNPDIILVVLEAAATTVGKKPATTFLDKKFTQRSHNRYNTLYFEIGPGYVDRKLTWGDVGEVLGEEGLQRFYEEMEEWNTVYFTVMHGSRGELGRGAVRRWWHL